MKAKISQTSSPHFESPSPKATVYRSISACLRCRQKKIKCDQKFPSCSSCLRARAECVGVDPATGREMPRSYVYSLETKVSKLESALKEVGLDPEALYNGRAKLSLSQISTSSVSATGASGAPSSFLGATSGISFARLMFAAVQLRGSDLDMSSVSNFSSSSVPKQSVDETPIYPARLPAKDVAERLLETFFTQANAQLPIIHREEFINNCFKPIYGDLSPDVVLSSTPPPSTPPHIPTPSSTSSVEQSQPLEPNPTALYFLNLVFAIAIAVNHQHYPDRLPEAYHAAAMRHVDTLMNSSDRLEALQAILLLCLYSIMRPAFPGVWYTLGIALRICVDLGLHSESGIRINLFRLDMRRRLFWCTYVVDRQICVYLGRPPGIPDQSIKVPFPSLLDDALITPEGFIQPPVNIAPSYKQVSQAMFVIRRLQSEIQFILYDKGELPRRFSTLEDWKVDMWDRVQRWYASCPKSPSDMSCNFNLSFIDINYHQTRLLMYGICPASPMIPQENNLVINDAGKSIIYIYYRLLHDKSINYTWVAVHNLFMAGTSFLYSIYHSPVVRSQVSVQEIEDASNACMTVLNSLVNKCDAASECRDTFKLLTAAIIQL
ncbi:hypothetical protein CANCADRAFT_14066, partial [Tortispora caseinolytica NRRL Y-17796]